MNTHSSSSNNPGQRSGIKLKSILALLLLSLFVLAITAVTTAVAQEPDLPDEPVPYTPEGVIVNTTELPYGVLAQTNISANKDAFLSSLNPNTNYGFANTMGLGYAAGSFNAMRMLMEFDINAIPDNATIDKAEIFIYQQSVVPSGDASMGFKAQYMKAQWSEGSVTWNNANYLGGTEIGIGSISSSLGWKTGDVTDMVDRWYSGAQPNYGLIVTGDEGPQNNRSRVFRSRQFAGYVPYIQVTYTSCNDNDPPTSSMVPLPTWSGGSFLVQWGATDQSGSGVKWYDVQYNINSHGWVEWKKHTTSTSATFSDADNGDLVQFRTRAADNCGNVGDWSNIVSTRVDTQPPNVVVNSLPQFTYTSNFIVSWSGSDNGSGLKNMDVQYRVGGDGNWLNWLNDTTSFSATFTGAQNNTTYQFRARGTDNVGNVQPWGSAQAMTDVFFQPIANIEPFPSSTTSSDPFQVIWVGATPPGTGPLSFDIYVRHNGGAWTQWLSNVTVTTDNYSPTSGNGLYEFSAIAKNSVGQVEPWDQQPEQGILYNSDPNAFKFQSLPIVFKS
jgi:hypothetical protein